MPAGMFCGCLKSRPFTGPGIRMKMTERLVDHGTSVVAALVLLLAVSSPIRPSGASHVAPSPDNLPRRLVILSHGHSGESAMLAPLSLREANSLPSDIEAELDADIEDELTAKSPPATVFFDVLPSPCPELHSERGSFAVACPARPLLC